MIQNDKDKILKNYDYMYQELKLRSEPCEDISTDDCKMLRLYIGDKPDSYNFGTMFGIFEYENELYKFTWYIHKPKQGVASLSNRMTDLNKLIVTHYDDEDGESNIELVEEVSPGYGYKAFWQKTPEDQLDGFDLSLRKLMKSIKSYAISVQLCKQIRKFDRKHITWVNRIPGIITLQ